MNQFVEMTKDTVNTEVSEFFGQIQGRWNRYMEVAVLNFTQKGIDSSSDLEIKEMLTSLKDLFVNVHERFSTQSLVDFLDTLSNVGLELSIQGEQLVLSSTGNEDDILIKLENLYDEFPKY